MLSWWAALLVVPIVGGLVWLHLLGPDPWTKTIEYGVVISAVVVVLYTLLFQLQATRVAASARFIERWSDSNFAEMRKDLSQVIRGRTPADSVDRAKIIAILDFFEDLATAVLYRQAAEEQLNQDFHFGPGTVTVYTRAAPNTTSFRAEPCTSPPAAGPKARPSAHRR